MAWSDLFLPSGSQTSAEAQANADHQAAAIAAQDAYRVQAGTISADTLARNNAAIAASRNFAADQNSAAAQGFVSGLGDGWHNIAAAVKNPFTGLPLWVWVVAAAAALGFFIYLGGGKFLKGILKR